MMNIHQIILNMFNLHILDRCCATLWSNRLLNVYSFHILVVKISDFSSSALGMMTQAQRAGHFYLKSMPKGSINLHNLDRCRGTLWSNRLLNVYSFHILVAKISDFSSSVLGIYGGISHWLGSGLGSEIPEPSLSWAEPEPLVWTKFGSDFECRLRISDPSYRVFTLVAQLGLSSESKPSPELSQCEMPHDDTGTMGRPLLLEKYWYILRLVLFGKDY